MIGLIPATTLDPGSRTAAAAQPTPAGDPQQVIQQGLSELNQLRRDTSNDPEVQRQIQELITAMEHLDLRRFPGNPVDGRGASSAAAEWC